MPKVGDAIYKFDENHRVYQKDASGRGIGGPIFAEHFVAYTITGETPKSWLTGYRGEVKVNKKTMQSSAKGDLCGHLWYTE